MEKRSGNLGVDLLMKVARREPPPSIEERCRELESLAELGFDSVEDYIAWWPLEPTKGDFRFEAYREHAREAERFGLRYAVYPWIHAIPPWALEEQGFVPFRCLEHQRDTYSPSIWAPFTKWAFRRVYEAIEENLGDVLSAVYLAGPCDYGEVGYPTGMAKWVVPYPPQLDHVHPGYWCADELACCDFETQFGEPAVEPAAIDDPEKRIAFQRWYTGRMTEFFRWLASTAREVFPHRAIELRLGHGTELMAFGQDVDDLVDLCTDEGIALRSTQASLGPFSHKRLATPCRMFSIPYASEPMVDRDRGEFLTRLFKDASSGVQALFEYPQHLRDSRDLWRAVSPHLDDPPLPNDIALLFPSTDHRSRPDDGLPAKLLTLSDACRDYFDFDVLGESAVRRGALCRFRIVVMLGGGWIDPSVIAPIESFVARGGVVLVHGPPPIPLGSKEAASALFQSLAQAESVYPQNLEADPGEVAEIRFGAGEDEYFLGGEWFGPESAHWFWGGELDERRCRWTGGHASFRIPAPRGSRAVLELAVATPRVAQGQVVELRCDGAHLARVDSVGAADLRFDLEGTKSVTEIEILSEPFQPAGDERGLGIVVRSARVSSPEGVAPSGPRDLWSVVSTDEIARKIVRWKKGGIVRSPKGDVPTLVATANELVHRFSALFPGQRNAPEVDGLRDGVWTSRFERTTWFLNTRDCEKRAPRLPVVIPPRGLAVCDHAGREILVVEP